MLSAQSAALAWVSCLRVASSRAHSKVPSTTEHSALLVCERSEFSVEVKSQFIIKGVQGKSELERVRHGKKGGREERREENVAAIILL